MSDQKETVRRRFTGAGVVTLLLAGGFAVFATSPTAPATLFVVGWLAIAGSALLVAGVRERFPVGTTTVGWPHIAAFGLAVLALGSTTIGFVLLLEGQVPWGVGTGVVTLLVGLFLVWAALECWLGGIHLDEGTFAVESPK